MQFRRLVVIALALVSPVLAAPAQGSARLNELVDGLTVTPRVLIFGARPDDAPAELIAWLARGKHVQTAYLALTRGESATNYAGLETGVALGAIHVKEMLAARAIDGGEQFYTMAYDFGRSRNAGEAYTQWNHDSLLADVVRVIRAYRPQVVIVMHTLDTTEADGQRQIVAKLAREAFTGATDSVTYKPADFGLSWTPSSLFEPGSDFTLDANGFQRGTGKTYLALGAESRAQLRTYGFLDSKPWLTDTRVGLHRVFPQEKATGLFTGIDTTFAKLASSLAQDAKPFVAVMQTYADSAHAALDLSPASVLGYVAHVAEAATTVRGRLIGCKHPAIDAATPALYNQCRTTMLDGDATIDLILRRATEALRIAGGLEVTAFADREFLAKGDSALVTVTVSNHGTTPITISDVGITGARSARLTATLTLAPDSSVRIARYVRDLAAAHPWWINDRTDNSFISIIASPDGVDRGGLVYKPTSVPAVGIPENIRRLSDITIYARIARVSVATSVGAILYRMADPVVGMQDRALSAVPPVTLAFERALEWMRANVPIDRQLILTMRNRSDTAHTLTMRVAGIKNLRVDSIPGTFTMEAGEQREIPIRLRGKVDTARYEFGVGAANGRDVCAAGLRTAQYTYLTPLNFFRTSGLYLRAVNVDFPPTLSVAYVRGGNDDLAAAFKQLGIPAVAFHADELRRLEIENVSTIILGPRAVDREPELLYQSKRIRDWVRKGGTLIVMDNPKIFSSDFLPFAVAKAGERTEDVIVPESSVSPVDASARLLNWPNKITAGDWTKWAGPRALGIPTAPNIGWGKILRMADPGEKPNDNSLLSVQVGKGTIIYTTITFPQQIANGVPGAMRLLVNMASASATRH